MSNLLEFVLTVCAISITVLVLDYIYDQIHERKCRTKVQVIASACYNLQADIARVADDQFLGEDFTERIATIRKEIACYQESFRKSPVRWSILLRIGKSLQRRAEGTLANARTDIEVRTALCEEYTSLLPVVTEAVQVPLHEGDPFVTEHWHTIGHASSDVKGDGIFYAMFLLRLLHRTYC